MYKRYRLREARGKFLVQDHKTRKVLGIILDARAARICVTALNLIRDGFDPMDYYGAYSETRAPFSGTALYETADGKTVEVTMITNDYNQIIRYQNDNKDAVNHGKIKKDSYKPGKAGSNEGTERTLLTEATHNRV